MTLLFGFAAVNTGNNLLFLIVAAQLGFMAVSGILGWLNLRRLGVKVTFPDEIYCGAETLVTVHLQNNRPIMPSFLIRVHLFGATADFPIVEKGNSGSTPLSVRFDRRGRNRVEGCRISSIFPVNFFTRFRPREVTEACVVFPQPSRAQAVDNVGAGKAGLAETIIRGYDGDVAKIGDYTGVEPQKLIHWRLSARHEQFKVKEMTALSAEPVIIDVSALAGANIEERLSRAAWLVNRLIRDNRPVGLRIGAKTVAPAATRDHRLRLLRELALHDQD